MKRRNFHEAIRSFERSKDCRHLAWTFEEGRAYLAAGDPTEANIEFDMCTKRRGGRRQLSF